MEKWMIKSAVQRVLSWLPKSYYWNRLLQKYATRNLVLSEPIFRNKLADCRTHLDFYTRLSSRPKSEFTAFELGIGTFPIVPIGLLLSGAKKVIAYDIAPVLEPFTLKQTLEWFDRSSKEGKLQGHLPGLRPEKLRCIGEALAIVDRGPINETLGKLNIELVVGDARKTTLPTGSIDLSYSTYVMEHIPASIIQGLLTEALRFCTPESVHSHLAGPSDQFSNDDRSINQYNYLRYTSAQWRWRNSPLIPQTRYRVTDYRRIFNGAGFEIVEEILKRGTIEQLRSIPLAPEFQSYPEEDLLVYYAWFAARPVRKVPPSL